MTFITLLLFSFSVFCFFTMVCHHNKVISSEPFSMQAILLSPLLNLSLHLFVSVPCHSYMLSSINDQPLSDCWKLQHYWTSGIYDRSMKLRLSHDYDFCTWQLKTVVVSHGHIIIFATFSASFSQAESRGKSTEKVTNPSYKSLPLSSLFFSKELQGFHSCIMYPPMASSAGILQCPSCPCAEL